MGRIGKINVVKTGYVVALKIISGIANGLPRKAIAEELELSRKAIDYHVSKVYREAGVRCIAELVHYAIFNKIVPLKTDFTRMVCAYRHCQGPLTGGQRKFCSRRHGIYERAIVRRATKARVYLRNCAYACCGKRFRTYRRRKIYHSKKCQQRAGRRRWAVKHPERVEGAHERYRAKLQSSNAKPRRRISPKD